MTKRMRFVAVPFLALALLGACGDDDEDAGDDTTTEATDDSASEAGDDTTEVCALAEELNEQDFPTPEQVEEYAALVPEDLQDEVEIAGAALSAGDPPAIFAAIAADDAEDALVAINEFETEACGIDHSDDEFPPHLEVDGDANRVDVVAADYSFTFSDSLPAGATSFVMTNEGEEAHFMTLTKIAEGHTLDEALAFEGGDPEDAGIVEDVEGGDSALAAPGGEDEEVMNVDLEPGTYAMLCFITGPDGETPHAFMGMVKEFTVS